MKAGGTPNTRGPRISRTPSEISRCPTKALVSARVISQRPAPVTRAKRTPIGAVAGCGGERREAQADHERQPEANIVFSSSSSRLSPSLIADHARRSKRNNSGNQNSKQLLRRPKIEVHPDFSEAPHIRSSIAHPKTDLAKIKLHRGE